MNIPAEWHTKAPRLSVIAAWVNANTALVAQMDRVYCNTGRKAGRLRIPGKGRNGTRILIAKSAEAMRAYHLTGRNHAPLLLDHNAAETYRCNADVVRWLANYDGHE